MSEIGTTKEQNKEIQDLVTGWANHKKLLSSYLEEFMYDRKYNFVL
jgi:hypothetical protein